jgi:hypothetical protein
LTKTKVNIEIFIPFGSCACASAPLIDKVARVASKHSNVDFAIKSTSSKEARQYAVNESCVMINGSLKLSSTFTEQELEDALTKFLE